MENRTGLTCVVGQPAVGEAEAVLPQQGDGGRRIVASGLER